MSAVITADIINSERINPETWIDAIKIFFKSQHITTKQWAIYRGDEIQILLHDNRSCIRFAIMLKALIKSLSNEIDIRIAIGIGDTTYEAQNVTQSNGPAFIKSGRLLDEIKKSKVNFALASPNKKLTSTFNLMLNLASVIMDSWSIADAELMFILLEKDNKLLQSEIADDLGIKQSSVSRRKSRAGYDNIEAVIRFYEASFQYEEVESQVLFAAEP